MWRDGTLILCYHRVAEGVEDPYHLCVRPGNFAAHLEELSKARELFDTRRYIGSVTPASGGRDLR